MPLVRSSLHSSLAAAILAAAALTAPPVAVGSMPPGKPPAERNAALVYWKSWAMLEDTALKTTVDWNAIGANTDPAKMPEEFTKTAKALGAWDDSIRMLDEASRMKVCDFELAYEQGFGLLLPHLSKFRGGARLLRIDARRLLMENKPDVAAQRVATMLRMSRQLHDDGILISSLVGMAVAMSAMEEGEVLVASGKLTRSQAAEMISAADALAVPDAVGVRSCVAGEGKVMSDWIKSQFTSPTAGKEFVSTWLKDLEGPDTKGNHAKAREAISSMTGAQLAADADKVLAGYKEIDAHWNDADYKASFSRIWDRIDAGEMGNLGLLVFPSFNKSRDSVAKFEQTVAAFRKNLSTLK